MRSLHRSLFWSSYKDVGPLKERDSLRIKLESLDVLPIKPAVWEQAYELGFSLRRKGLTIPTADLIIAALAIENNIFLVHHDEHFEMIVPCFPNLKTKYFNLKLMQIGSR